MQRRRVGVVTGVLWTLLTVQAHTDPLPRWDTQMNDPARFVVLTDFQKEAVLDQETGLVWEQTPSTTGTIWGNAVRNCQDKAVGQRKGWRLPTIEELTSLVDPTQNSPALPKEHPFANVQPQPADRYWSSTVAADLPSRAQTVNFTTGTVVPIQKPGTLLAWCVRGGQGLNGP